MSSSLESLLKESCAPLAKGTPALDSSTAAKLLDAIQNWGLKADNSSITRTFTFSNFYETMSFVNAVAWIAHQQDHHPDMNISYRQCTVTYSTHSVNGLSRNDFICAAKINQFSE